MRRGELAHTNRERERMQKKSVFDDAYLAEELNRLSVQERAKVTKEIHGVFEEEQEETDEFIVRCIEELDACINIIPTKDRKQYNRAVFLKPTLQNDTKFKLMFLRADQYDASEAGKRIVRYFQEKSELFGEDKIVKRITVDDLIEDEIEVFRSGSFFALPVKDAAGRPVLVCDTSKGDLSRFSTNMMLRSSWYHVMAAIVDEEMAQKRGVCGCTILNSKVVMQRLSPPSTKNWSLDLAGRVAHMQSCLPFRYSSHHICCDDNSPVGFCLNTFRAILPKKVRLRMRTHLGSALENEYKLMTFGISYKSFLQEAERGNTEYSMEYMQRRRDIDKEAYEKEAQGESQSGIISYPKLNDVLIGRGAPYRDFPGNTRWNQLTQRELHGYQNSDRFGKVCVSMNVVKEIQESNGRFLERTNDGWKPIDDNAARKRAAMAFQNKVKMLNSTDAAATTTTATRPVEATSMEGDGYGGPASKARRRH